MLLFHPEQSFNATSKHEEFESPTKVLEKRKSRNTEVYAKRDVKTQGVKGTDTPKNGITTDEAERYQNVPFLTAPSFIERPNRESMQSNQDQKQSPVQMLNYQKTTAHMDRSREIQSLGIMKNKKNRTSLMNKVDFKLHHIKESGNPDEPAILSDTGQKQSHRVIPKTYHDFNSVQNDQNSIDTQSQVSSKIAMNIALAGYPIHKGSRSTTNQSHKELLFKQSQPLGKSKIFEFSDKGSAASKTGPTKKNDVQVLKALGGKEVRRLEQTSQYLELLKQTKSNSKVPSLSPNAFVSPTPSITPRQSQ